MHPQPSQGMRSQDGEDKEGEGGFSQIVFIREERRALDNIALQKPEACGVVGMPSEQFRVNRPQLELIVI